MHAVGGTATRTHRHGRTSASPFTHEPVPPASLANLRKYRYSSADHSFMSRYVFQGYWNFLVGLVPMTVAPNAITLTGFLIGLSMSVVLLVCYCLSGSGADDATLYPAWTWYYAAFSLFVYQTLDAMDGKQARRTGTCSPLGELFDHGCDAFLTPFVQLNTCLCIRAPPWMRYCYLMQSSLALFGAIWEQYTVGTMQLGYMSGPTEGIVLTCLIFLARGYFGAGVWDTTVVGPYTWTPPAPSALLRRLPPPLAPSPSAIAVDAAGDGKASLWSTPVTVHIGSLRSIVFLFFTVAWVATVLSNVTNALAWRPRGSGRSCLTAYTSGLPLLLLACLHAAMYVVYQDVQRRFPLVFEFSFGLLVTYTVTRMTIARLCMMPYRYTHNVVYLALLSLTLLALLAHALGYGGDRVVVGGGGGGVHVGQMLGWALVTLVVLEVVLYAHMILAVFVQFARFLGVRILSIAPLTSKSNGSCSSSSNGSSSSSSSGGGGGGNAMSVGGSGGGSGSRVASKRD